MSDISALTKSTATSTSSAATTGLSGNYDLFISMLTTQIQNQDPLDPLDSAEYTNQLVQYSAVEQSIQTNSHLEKLLASFESSRASSYVSYLGQEVRASGATTMLRNGEASWSYSISEAASGRVEVRDALGAVVYEGDVDLEGGDGTWSWNGLTTNGGKAADGAYTVSFEVFDSDADFERVTIEVSGIVDRVNMTGNSATLKISNVEIPVSSVISVSSGS